MRKTLSLLASVFVSALSVGAQPPQSVALPARGSFYADPLTGNKVWRVTDAKLCPSGAFHHYSYWPVWNADGSHLLIACQSGPSHHALLVRDADLSVVRRVSLGPALDPQKLFWSWTDPEAAYGHNPEEIWRWNPFTGKGKQVAKRPRQKVQGLEFYHLRLAYVSFDDRYLLAELQGPNPAQRKNSEWNVLALGVFDMREGAWAAILDISEWPSYDEAVFTKDNHVWVVTGKDSYVYGLDFSTRVRIADHGHHAHGLLPDGTPVAVKAGSNQSCPSGSKAGSPHDAGYPQQGWKPTALILSEREKTASREAGPFPAELHKIACDVSGKHDFAHFSWNNQQRDHFFVSTWGYGGFVDDPLAHAIIRVRLRFDATGRINGDQPQVLAHHRSEDRNGYWASPRASCNQQGTRCLFASTMTIGTDNASRQPHLYIVEVPPT